MGLKGQSLEISQTYQNYRFCSDLSYNKDLRGPLPASIGNLKKLKYLILVGCSFSGPIPNSVGSLQQLVYFHLGKNQLSGEIPSKLFSSDMISYMCFLTATNSPEVFFYPCPWQTLEVIRFDRNSLIGPVPSNLNVLTKSVFVQQWIDWTSSQPHWDEFLNYLMMEGTQLQGQIPPSFFSLANLQTVVLSNNRLNGTLDIGTINSDQLQLIDLQTNSISDYTPKPGQKQVDIILVNNPVCQETGVIASYCTVSRPNSSYVTLPNNCVPIPCRSNQISSPNCNCAYAYTGLLVFRAPSFSDLGNITIYISLQRSLMDSFRSNQLPVDSVSLSNPRKDLSEYLDLNLQVFPFDRDYFNQTIISQIGFVLSNQTFKPPKFFGPYYFIGDVYHYFAGEATRSNNSSNTGIIIGAVAGGSALLLLLVLAGLYAYRQKKRAERATEWNNPFAHWDSTKSSGAGFPQLKGARFFSFEELKKYTNNFSEANDIGSGGYGKVYRGVLPNGQLIAIKRAQQESLQGALEFKTEIELLSRVHHKNVVSLLGFCFERGEQMLIYEFVPNGSLNESLSVREVRMAMDRTKDLYNLHELLDPSIGLQTTLKGLDKFVDLAMECVKESGADRPIMGDVVKEIENILQLAGLNPNAESASTSASYEEAGKGSPRHPYSKDAFDYSGAFPPSKLEPQ
ncbi:hypothetical protein GH714_006745 [Hevea brasiliensis]|uniref:Protein kinase domain-containing protein n=1 Tax=Hevea brasiliensis TaxID=3981 RepID=A0A6A6MD49_HEVBR|nr:hypothetical protein GH714_006745 [Hevea brasiliensis]